MSGKIDFSSKDNFCNVIILCTGTPNNQGELYFCKALLAKHSEYFRTMLPDNKGTVTIGLSKPLSIVNDLLNYLSKKEMEIGLGNIFGLLEISEEYEIDNLHEDCINVFIANMRILDPILVINICCVYNVERLKTEFMKYGKYLNGKLSDLIINSVYLPRINQDFGDFMPTWLDELKVLYALCRTTGVAILEKISFVNLLYEYIEQFVDVDCFDPQVIELDLYMNELVKSFNKENTWSMFVDYFKSKKPKA